MREALLGLFGTIEQAASGLALCDRSGVLLRVRGVLTVKVADNDGRLLIRSGLVDRCALRKALANGVAVQVSLWIPPRSLARFV